jgi:hypothetical protein
MTRRTDLFRLGEHIPFSLSFRRFCEKQTKDKRSSHTLFKFSSECNRTRYLQLQGSEAWCGLPFDLGHLRTQPGVEYRNRFPLGFERPQTLLRFDRYVVPSS